MQELNLLIDQIPVRHNLVSSFIFSGLIVTLFTSVIILLRSGKKNKPIRLFGLLMLVFAIIGFDGYICYTGLIKNVLHLNDSTEPLVLLLGPLIYLFLRTLLDRKSVSFKWDGLHFLPSVIYALIQLPYYAQPLACKYNAYTRAYHPQLPQYDIEYSQLFILSDGMKGYFRWFVLGSFLLYVILSVKIYFETIWGDRADKNIKNSKNTFSRSIIIAGLFTLVLVVIIFFNFKNDLGDHYIWIFFTICNFLAAGFILSESRFFERAWISDKYETSGLKASQENIFDKINIYVKENEYYLNSNTSLSDLSGKLSIPGNYISQAINKDKGTNFNDYINRLRITEAKKRLTAENYKHYNIESIGESVGFNAKSTFYAAFKKQTGMTPSAYLKSL